MHSSDKDVVPSHLCDGTLTMRKSGTSSLHHCSFRSEKNRRTERQACRSFEESLSPAQSFFVCHSSTGRPVHELRPQSSRNREKPSREMENETIRILFVRQKKQKKMSKSGFFWNDKKSRFSPVVEQRFRNTSSKSINDSALARDEQHRRDQQLVHVQTVGTKSGIFVKLMKKLSMRWKN